jgi:hypothetical protein
MEGWSRRDQDNFYFWLIIAFIACVVAARFLVDALYDLP